MMHDQLQRRSWEFGELLALNSRWQRMRAFFKTVLDELGRTAGRICWMSDSMGGFCLFAWHERIAVCFLGCNV